MSDAAPITPYGERLAALAITPYGPTAPHVVTKWHDLDLVFAGPLGLPVEPSSVSKRLHALLAPIGLGHVRLHDLRHHFAGLMIGAGVELAVVSKLMGHSTLTITADYYLRLVPAVKRDAADRLGALMRTGS